MRSDKHDHQSDHQSDHRDPIDPLRLAVWSATWEGLGGRGGYAPHDGLGPVATISCLLASVPTNRYRKKEDALARAPTQPNNCARERNYSEDDQSASEKSR